MYHLMHKLKQNVLNQIALNYIYSKIYAKNQLGWNDGTSPLTLLPHLFHRRSIIKGGGLDIREHKFFT